MQITVAMDSGLPASRPRRGGTELQRGLSPGSDSPLGAGRRQVGEKFPMLFPSTDERPS